MVSKPESESKKSSIRYTSIVLAMLSAARLNGVRALKPEPTKHSLARAVLYLKHEGHDAHAEELAAYVRRQHPRGKSKKVPQAGDVRMYSVLAQRGNLYVRIPVSVLGPKKGDLIQTVFEEDKVTMRHLKLDAPMPHAEAHAKKKRKTR